MKPPTRKDDRLSAAALRAVAAEPLAQIRGSRLEVDRRPIGVVVPYLAGDHDKLSFELRRGVVDALGLRVRHSDRDLHLELSPTEPLERIVFDIAEQFRCESLTGTPLRGVRSNINAAFDHWSDTAQAERLTETGIGLLIFTITHMLRYRLLGTATSETVDDVIEVTRGNLGRLVGHALKPLRSLQHSQRDYAVPAAEMARLIAEMAGDAAEITDVAEADDERQRLLIPIDWDTLDHELATASSAQARANAGSDYSVFSDAYDIEVPGDSLYRPEVLRSLRSELEELKASQVVSAARLAQRLAQLLGSWQSDGNHGGHQDGALDSSRLARIVANPADREIYQQPVMRPSTEAVVSFVIDTSGSMKVQRYQSVAVLVDTLVRALDMAGAQSEVLGFTTASWSGGRPKQTWIKQGRPADPGRLAELQHIVYKSADQTWRQARLSLAAMLRTDHYREGVDGEALQWAAERIGARPEPKKLLVLISDGLPMEVATASANRDDYLGDHLRSVCDQIDNGHKIDVGAITLEQDMGTFVTRSVSLDLDGTITIGTYDVLERLFS